MKNKKKLLCAILSLIMVVTAIYAAYQEPKEVHAIAVEISTAAAIAALLAGCGMVYTGVTWWQDGSAAENLDDLYGDEIGEIKEGKLVSIFQECMENLNISGGDDFNPEEDDPNDKVPSFEKLIQWIKLHPGETIMTTGTALAAVLLKFANALKDDADTISYIPSSLSVALDSESRKWIDNMFAYGEKYLMVGIEDGTGAPLIIFVKPEGRAARTQEGNYAACNVTYFRQYNHCSFRSSSYSSWYGFPEKNFLYSNFSFHPDYTTCTNPVSENEFYPYNDLDSENVKYGSMLETGDDNEITSLPVSQINASALVQNWPQILPALQNQLALGLDPAEKVDEIINTVGTAPSKPPSIAPDIEESPELEPLPEIEGVDGLDKGSFLLPDWITEKFPFCVPFDIIRAFSVLESSSRTAPKITLPLKAERYGIDYELDIDLAVFDEVATLLRSLELILFVIGLALVSRDLIKG